MVTHYKYCAGILPFCYFNHSLYFLLGKSKRNNRLITFSGKNDELESDPRETAAREGYEETKHRIFSYVLRSILFIFSSLGSN